MYSASKLGLAGVLCFAAVAAHGAATLRVCADPNNLPYSNEQQQGFENRIADLIAKDFGMDATYFWFPQREKFFRKTLNSGVCDVVMGVPAGFDEAATTHPYYRSSYVFIARKNRNLRIHSFDDPRLRTLKIGVHVFGDQNDSPPPVHAFTSRGIVRNLVGFSIYGNLNEQDPPADLIRAVEEGKIDLAVAWGPTAGYFAQLSKVPLELTPVDNDPQHPDLPFAFSIGIGVRNGDNAFRQKLDDELTRRRAEIEQILHSYGVPLVKPAEQAARSAED